MGPTSIAYLDLSRNKSSYRNQYIKVDLTSTIYENNQYVRLITLRAIDLQLFGISQSLKCIIIDTFQANNLMGNSLIWRAKTCLKQDYLIIWLDCGTIGGIYESGKEKLHHMWINYNGWGPIHCSNEHEKLNDRMYYSAYSIMFHHMNLFVSFCWTASFKDQNGIGEWRGPARFLLLFI